MDDKKVLQLIYALSLVVFGLVIALFNLPQASYIPVFVKFLPTLNAFLNGTCSLLLIASFFFIKRNKIIIHRNLNITAFVLSAIFLLSYVTFHSYGIETFFPKENPLRPIYLIILLSHILLAALVLPLVLISFYHGLKGNIEKHKKITKWSFPIWVYVTLSGVLVYIMISPYYNF